MNNTTIRALLIILMATVSVSCNKTDTVDASTLIDPLFEKPLTIDLITKKFESEYVDSEVENPNEVFGEWLVMPQNNILGFGESSQVQVGSMKWVKIKGLKTRGLAYQPILLFRANGETEYLLLKRPESGAISNAEQ